MKKLLLVLLLANLTLSTFSQTMVLAGKVTNPAYEPIELNIPFDGAYHQINSIYCKPGQKGQYKFTIKGNHPKFVILRYKKQERHLLLMPGKPLFANFNADDMAGTLKLTGTGKIYNDLLQQTAINNSQLLVNKLADYKKWPADSLLTIMLPSINRELSASLKEVYQSKNSPAIKTLFTTELNYYYANSLLRFSRSIMFKMTRKAAWKRLEDTVINTTTFPNATQIATSPEANTYLHEYTLHQFKEVGLQVREKPANAKTIIESQVDMPYDTAMARANQYGEDYLLAIVAHKYLDKMAEEKLLANMTLQYTDIKDLKFANRLQLDLSTKFPYSAYLQLTGQKIAMLTKVMTENEKNKNIIFIPADTKLTTIQQLVAPYKGKAVYVDIWGTWCGPCVNEIIEHSAAVKQKFKHKNIVFLYLDMDYDKDGSKWKDFINVHNLTGYHFRASQAQMENIWVNLYNTKDVPRFFPTYLIFDTQGNLLNNNAKRPSDGEALYSQLEAALK